MDGEETHKNDKETAFGGSSIIHPTSNIVARA
jgi:hypothetical protein